MVLKNSTPKLIWRKNNLRGNEFLIFPQYTVTYDFDIFVEIQLSLNTAFLKLILRNLNTTENMHRKWFTEILVSSEKQSKMSDW